jgi:uncharacterized protein (TIGR01777 family)
MAKNILITGASGLIGTRLTELLLERGHHVSHLGRKKKEGHIASFAWDIEKKYIDPQAIVNADVVVHLAGAGVTDNRWTDKRKKQILESRTHSVALLFDAMSKSRPRVTTFVSASGIGYYGSEDKEEVLTEESAPGKDFLANVTCAWEESVNTLTSLAIRVVTLRIGIVLSEKGGALKRLALPVKFGIGAPLGSGDQYLSWIHLDDLCRMFIKAIENENMQGTYNATGIEPVTNRQLTHAIARVLKKPLWVPPVPGFVLKIILGEMADVVIHGSKVSSQKIQRLGFEFKFPDLRDALRDLFKAGE